MARLLAFLVAASLFGADYQAPAGVRPAQRRPGAASLLPGGRLISPAGRQFTTGPGSFGIAVSPSGKTVVTADGGPRMFSLTLLSQVAPNKWQTESIVPYKIEKGEYDDADWLSVFMGVAFEDERSLFVSEGNTGVVRLIDARNGKKKQLFHLNQGDWRDSFSGDLAYDAKRELLYVLDQANFRLAIFDTRRRKLMSSLRVGRLPFAIALSPDGKRVYVTNTGMFEYRPISGAGTRETAATGLPFPAFGFPSQEAAQGMETKNRAGETVRVPGLGDPNAPEANSVAFVNVEEPAKPKLEGYARTGALFGSLSLGGSAPSGVLATADRVYVTNAHNDSVTVLHAQTRQPLAEIPLRIPGLENLRGVMPIGMALHEGTGWLLVAEAGINAIAVLDTRQNKVLGHIPAAWFPTAIRLVNETVYVANAKGHGTGPNAAREGQLTRTFQADIRRGALQMLPLPTPDELPALTQQVYANNGFLPSKTKPLALPEEIRHVVMIVKENRTYDEVFGDIASASNGPASGIWDLARFGTPGTLRSNTPGALAQRFSLRNVNVTPNHHALAQRFAFSDNFYADSEGNVDGHHWLIGNYPDPWLETTAMSGGLKPFRLETKAPGRLRFVSSNSGLHPDNQQENGTLWHHLARHNISFRNYGEGFELAGTDAGPGLKPTGAAALVNAPMPQPLYENTSRDYPQFNTNIPDQYRATQFINEIDKLYVQPGKDLPRLLYLHLPNDFMAKPRPEDGYPFEASYVADNDLALGRIIEYLSNSKWWPNMAIFVTEDDTQGGIDHIDSHRTVLLVASPYAKRNYVSHTNSSFPGLLKTVFRLLRLPPLNLYDATASDLADCFTNQPDFTPYQLVPARKELFDPNTAR